MSLTCQVISNIFFASIASRDKTLKASTEGSFGSKVVTRHGRGKGGR